MGTTFRDKLGANVALGNVGVWPCPIAVTTVRRSALGASLRPTALSSRGLPMTEYCGCGNTGEPGR